MGAIGLDCRPEVVGTHQGVKLARGEGPRSWPAGPAPIVVEGVDQEQGQLGGKGHPTLDWGGRSQLGWLAGRSGRFSDQLLWCYGRWLLYL